MGLGIEWTQTTAMLRCEKCGVVSLSENEYVVQLWDAFVQWHCPRCGIHATWVDESDITREANGNG